MKKLLVAGIILTLVISSLVFIIYEMTSNREEKPQKEAITEETVDDRISPLTNQGLTVDILRIRHRGLLDRMFKLNGDWKKKPVFYWVTIVDGKECNSSTIEAAGGVKGEGVFNEWDTFLKECRVNYFVEEEQVSSDVVIKIVERVKRGLFGEKDIERETIHLTYDYRTGRWTGDDYLKDSDGYGHYVGKTFEVWFNVYQSDYDHDGIPYWIEVNVLHTDPMVDDSKLDPDGDGIPTSWEWKWGYDPYTWDDHENLDPDIDGIENIEEYKMSKWFANPYQPDIYLEADGMKRGSFLDWDHIFYEESQQMLIERFCQHGINLYIDYGWPDAPKNAGGEMLPFIQTLDLVVGGHMKRFYEHHFPDERKGIFRYMNIANNAGFCTASRYNYYDHIVIDTSLYKTFFKRFAFTPRQWRVALAKGVLHELGHSMGLMPYTFKGIDIMAPIGSRYPSMPEEEYRKYLTQYHSIMNYKYIFMDRDLFDYSDGSNGPPYDENDWEHLYLPAFEMEAFCLLYTSPSPRD